jgi:glutamate/tyrosine decarboxylase-like PLP-dependent enzyme
VRVLVGAEAHVTVRSALRYLGLGGRPTVVPADAQGRMDPEALERALAAGEGPAIVVAQAGHVNTGAFDPVQKIADACARHGAWLHVDGAFGLWAMAVPELAHLTAGLERADSWSVDGHKWLQLPYDSAFAIVRHPAAHARAMDVTASYLPPASGAETDPCQFVPELSRRARGFAAWATLRGLGRQGVQAMVRRHCALARRLAERLSPEPGVRVLNEVTLNQLIVGFGEGDQAERDRLARAVIARLQQENDWLALGAAWDGGWVMRISVISAPLTEADIDGLADAIIAAWRKERPQLERAAAVQN